MSLNNLKPGRELDALIAEKIFGWRDIDWQNDYRGGKNRFLRGIGPRDRYSRKVPHYSTDISDAWRIVDELRGSSSVAWETFGHELCDHFNLLRGDAPIRICRAALKARGMETVDAILKSVR